MALEPQPAPSFSTSSSAKQKLSTLVKCGLDDGALSHPRPAPETVVSPQEKKAASVSHPSKFCLAEANSEQMQARGCLPSIQLSFIGWRLYQAREIGNNVPPYVNKYSPCPSLLVRQTFHASRGKLRKPQATTLTQHPAHKVEEAPEDKGSMVLSHSSGALTQRFLPMSRGRP